MVQDLIAFVSLSPMVGLKDLDLSQITDEIKKNLKCVRMADGLCLFN